MPKIMEIIEKETKGKSYHTYKYSYSSIRKNLRCRLKLATTRSPSKTISRNEGELNVKAPLF